MDVNARAIALNEQRMRAWEAGKKLLEDTEGRAMSAEENAEFARINAEIDDLAEQVRNMVAFAKRQAETEALTEATLSVFGEARVAQAEKSENERLREFLLGGPGKEWEVDIRMLQRERDILRAGGSPTELRALAWDTGNSASLVPTTLARTLYQYMEASNGFMSAPTTKIVTSSGENIDFPYLSAHAIATQVAGQGTALAGTDPSFTKLTIGAYKYGELVVVANELLTDPGVDLATFIGRDLGRALGRKIDTDLVVGTGTGQPKGVMTAATGSVTTGGSLITFTVDNLVSLQYSVVDTYRNTPTAAWLMNDMTAGTIRKLRDGAGGTVGAFLWNPSLMNGIQGDQPDRLFGKPVVTDSNVATSASNARVIAFGDMSAYYVRQVGNPVIESDASRYFDTDQTGFRGKWRVSGNLIDTNAVKVLIQNV